MIVAPFPFESLPKLSRADVLAQRRVRELAASRAPLESIERALSEVTNAPVRIRPSRQRARVTGVSVSFAAGEHGVVVDAETALARELVARAMKHPPGIDGGKPPSPALQGAFAAVLVHALRKTPVGAATLRSAPPEPSTVVGLSVDVDGARFDASVTIPDRVLAPPAPAVSFEYPISLRVVAITCLARRDDVGLLAKGDVFVPPGLSLKHLALVPARSERGIAATLTANDRLVIGKDAHHPWEPTMSAETNPTLEVALEAPVVVRVELGAVEMKAREWAALAEGDVITLQRKLGEPAILRIAGNEVARGELVQVDGEYGIRITSR